MIRFYYVLILRIFSIIYFVPKMAYYAKNTKKYSERDRYLLAQEVIRGVKKTARITTYYYGEENLPKKDGYIMYSNHQGKYDALGIISCHLRPCTILMDDKRSRLPIAKQFVDLLKGQRLSRDSIRRQIKALQNIAFEVQSGRNYLVFPEGGYRKNQDNITNEFKGGCFSCAIRAKCPIVPVAIIDSFIPFGINSLRPVETVVIFLPPIYYDEYKGLNKTEIASVVKGRIDEAIFKHTHGVNIVTSDRAVS